MNQTLSMELPEKLLGVLSKQVARVVFAKGKTRE
jgi:hypothetical protein